MLNYLFRANANNNGVYLSAIYDVDSNPVLIKKSSTTLSTISRLKKEVRGANWYAKISNEKLISQIIDLPSYYSVSFDYILGKKANYRFGYWKNRKFIEEGLKKYCEVWSKLSSNEIVIHGDYSLDNLIFGETNICIIDWEHFSESNIPIGFDALNLIYEQLYFLPSSKRLDDDILDHAISMLKKLNDLNCLDKKYWNTPLFTLRRFISSNSEIWGSQIHKLPVMKLSDIDVEKLDQKLCLREI